MAHEEHRALGEKLLQQTPYRVFVHGTEVILEIAGKPLRMHRDTALHISHCLRHCARIAKRSAGDEPKLRGFADLTDAHAEEMRAHISKDRKSILVTP